jgi:tetratricopeptide (TPR) repeat protein
MAWGKVRDWIFPLGVMAISAALFMPATCRYVYWQDAAIYPVSLSGLSNTIPPGFPVYMLLGLGAWLVTVTNGIFALNLLSSLGAVAAVCLAWFAVRELLHNFGDAPSRWGATVAAVLLLASPTLRDESTACEVYSVSLALQAGIIWLLAKYAHLGKPSLFLLATLVFGLLLGVHPQPVFLLPFWLLFAFLVRPKSAVRILPLALLFFLLAFSDYLYLPLRSLAQPLNDWGHPGTWERFYFHLTAQQYGFQMFNSSWTIMGDRGIALLGMIQEQWGWGGIIGALLGFAIIVRYKWRLVFLIMLPMVVCSLVALGYPSYGFRAWHLPLYLAMTIGMGFLWAWILAQLPAWNKVKIVVSGAIILLVLGFALVTEPHYWRGDYRLADSAGRNLLTTLPPTATVVMKMEASEGMSQMAALKQVYLLRPDVEIYDFTGNGFFHDVPGQLGIDYSANLFRRLRLLAQAEDALISAHPNGVFYTYPQARLEQMCRMGEWGMWFYVGTPNLHGNAWDQVKWEGFDQWAWRLDGWARDYVGTSLLVEGMALIGTDYEKAQHLFAKATEMAERSHINSLNLADQYLHYGDYQNALWWVRRSLALDPTDPDAYRLAIMVTQKMGDDNLADEFRQAAKSRFPAQVW